MTREEAIAIFGDNDTVIENPNYLFTEIGEAWDMAIEALKEQRPHGEWIKFTLEGGFLSSHKCSNCGFNGNQLWHFCPSCGASMRVKDELNRVSKELNSEIEKSKSEIVPDYRDGCY